MSNTDPYQQTRHYRPTTKALDLSLSFGYLYTWEVLALQLLAQLLPPGAHCVNIGAGSGTSSLAIVESRPDLVVWTVDINPSSPLGGLENERNAFEDAGMPCPYQILGDSKEVGKTWDKGLLDYVFIDGGHVDWEVRGDIAAWLPHVKPGGIIAFHDYGSFFWPDVKVVVDDLMAPYTEIFTIDSVKAFRI